MRSVDLYTKVILSIIAGCLVVLSFEQAHWNKVETVQAQQPMLINGYTFDGQSYQLGTGAGQKPGIPVVVADHVKAAKGQ
jgi:hypothetical protein